MKDKIRENLDMLYDNIDNFNDFALQWIDKKELRHYISIWRWYASHNNFKENHPQLEKGKSKPSLGWLNSQLQGLSVPLHRDIAECIAPKVESSLKTQHAAMRIMNRLPMIYAYVTNEDMKADQQAHRDREDKKTKDRLRAAKARVDRKAERKEKHRLLIETEGPKLGEKYLKAKDRQRADEHNMRDKARAATRKAAEKIMKERK